MSWKVKISVGEVSAEIEIPLTDRSHISLDDDGTAKKTIKVFESLSQKVLETANSFEKSRADLYPTPDLGYPSPELKIHKIETMGDLPPFGRYVLVKGTDEKQYGIKRWHVCEMNDLEDGMEFKENGKFIWLTESGRQITDVTEWCELPSLDETKK